MSHIRGRFHKAADESVAKYTASIPFDWRLYRHDITGSIAHVRMLARQGIVSEKEAEVIAYEDLGAEAIMRLRVADFPAIVANDIYGKDLFKQGRAEYQIRRG